MPEGPNERLARLDQRIELFALAESVRGMKAEEAARLKKREDENRRLKQLVADLSLDNQMLKDVAE
jgi:putative transposase